MKNLKKIVSILLAAAMLTAMLAFGASADTVIGSKDEAGYKGVDDFNDTTTGGQDLNVKVTDVTHKYAVDVTFGLTVVDLGGKIVWNVDTLKYDVTDSNTETMTREITVYNRSDLPVFSYAEVAKENADDSLTIKADKDSTANQLKIEKATGGTTTTAGTPTKGVITITVSSENWAGVASFYANKKLAENVSEFKVATITVTITKN